MIKKKTNLPTDAFVEQFVMLSQLLSSIYTEMKEFSKKKPDEPLNNFKVKNVNRVLEKVKTALTDEPTIEFLDLLDDESLPSNSDAILIIGQYIASMNSFRNKFINQYQRWSTVENPEGERR